MKKDIIEGYILGPEEGVTYDGGPTKYQQALDRIAKLEQENKIMKDALLEASEYHNTDDVNGEAGYICYKALKDVEGVR